MMIISRIVYKRCRESCVD